MTPIPRKVAAALAALSLAFGAAACGEDSVERDVDNAVQDVQDGAQDAGREVEEAAEDVGNGAEDAAKEIDEAAQDAEDGATGNGE